MSKRRPPAGDAQTHLLASAVAKGKLGDAPPLAERMRPRALGEMVGQRHLLGADQLLARALERDELPSLILWGPPGCGKTTLAHVIAQRTRAAFAPFSAVLGGLPELRELIAAAKERRRYEGRRTLLFVDEIHRFNKAQQDAFLPHLEDGTVTLVGATTENPSFSINAAVLSRCRVLRLEPLSPTDLVALLERAASDAERGLGARALRVTPEALALLARTADGDARRALGLLEASLALVAPGEEELDVATVERAGESRTLLFDKSGDEHYNVTSALIKSMRGSDPDAAIYWLMRLLDAGDDPLFVLRRLIIFASEDVGNADPRALGVATDADAAFRRLGMPEGLYPIAQACLYLASCPKSNSVGQAFTRARALIEAHGALPVPKKLRNPTTRLAREQGWGEGYRYAHDYPEHVVTGESYLPEALTGERLYEPGSQGLEQQIAERLARLRGRPPR